MNWHVVWVFLWFAVNIGGLFVPILEDWVVENKPLAASWYAGWAISCALMLGHLAAIHP